MGRKLQSAPKFVTFESPQALRASSPCAQGEPFYGACYGSSGFFSFFSGFASPEANAQILLKKGLLK